MLGADKMTVALTFAAFGSGVSVAAGIFEEIRGEGGAGWLKGGSAVQTSRRCADPFNQFPS